MKTKTAVGIAAAAIVLGAGTGVALLPRGDDGHVADPSASRAGAGSRSPSVSPSVSPSSGSGKLDTGELLTGADLTGAGYHGRLIPSLGKGEAQISSTDCADGEAAVPMLSDRAPLGSPTVHGTWRNAQQPVVREVAVQVAGDDQSSRLAQQVLAESEDCQDEPRSHWRYAATRHADLGDGVTADWMSLHNGTNTGSGVGPACGGVAVIRNHARFGVVFVDWCAAPPQLEKVATVAAQRLGGR